MRLNFQGASHKSFRKNRFGKSHASNSADNLNARSWWCLRGVIFKRLQACLHGTFFSENSFLLTWDGEHWDSEYSHLNTVAHRAWKAPLRHQMISFRNDECFYDFMLHLLDEFSQHSMENCRLSLMDVRNMFEFLLDQLFCHYIFFGVNWLLLTFTNFSIRSRRVKKVGARKWRANWEINCLAEVWLQPRKIKCETAWSWKTSNVKSSWNDH